jgi:hypothetical protein
MENIGLVLFIFLIGWLLFGYVNTWFRRVESIPEERLEEEYVEVKKKILRTSVYKNEIEYRRLYFRAHDLMERILSRHRRFILDVEAAQKNASNLFSRREYFDANGIVKVEYFVPLDLDLESLNSEILLYLSFFLWHGGQVKDLGQIQNNPELMTKIINFLISNRKYPPAIFFKGMVFKYGEKVYSDSKPKQARELLETAKALGVGSATLELKNLNLYIQLADVKSIHFD